MAMLPNMRQGSIGSRYTAFTNCPCQVAVRDPPIAPRRRILLSALGLLHDRLATSVLLFMAAVGVWGLASFIRGGTLSGSLAGALAIGQVLIAVQVLAGLAMVVGGRRPPSPVHYLYGVTAVLVLPFVWSYLRDRDQRQALLFYSLLTLFIAGLAVRGMNTGH